MDDDDDDDDNNDGGEEEEEEDGGDEEDDGGDDDAGGGDPEEIRDHGWKLTWRDGSKAKAQGPWSCRFSPANLTWSRKIHVAHSEEGSQPSTTPAPCNNHRIDEAGHEESKGSIGGALHTLRNCSAYNGSTSRTEGPPSKRRKKLCQWGCSRTFLEESPSSYGLPRIVDNLPRALQQPGTHWR